ncbi:DUF1622 domain-containing protein [Merismopedia glauca]|uniref:DUF1622 domain-containing protein n=2 Tax=Merismopedia TaxID=53402 RepID=A0A2T1C8K0_9CYAN|nr:hypothetical protein C7B64_03110 [Merismopedia glauca CCAP 1448/3]
MLINTVLAEELLQDAAILLKIGLELIAILIVAIAVVTIPKRIRGYRRRSATLEQLIRLDLGLSLALSLEFLLAADVVGTAISPSWDAVAKLAAITGIRTFLNFFLHRELKELQEIQTPLKSP